MDNVPAREDPQTRDPVTYAGVVIIAAAAMIVSFTAQAGLAELAGWRAEVGIGAARIPMAWLLPVCVDAYGLVATRVATMDRYSMRTRQQALVHAGAAIVISVLGNAMYHLIEAGVLVLGPGRWLLVVMVSVIPPITLGVAGHLLAMCMRDGHAAKAVPDGVPEPPYAVPAAEDQPDAVLGDDASAPGGVLLAGPGALPAPWQREAVQRWAPGGQITPDQVPSVRAIKTALRCGQPRAQEVRDLLASLTCAS